MSLLAHLVLMISLAALFAGGVPDKGHACAAFDVRAHLALWRPEPRDDHKRPLFGIETGGAGSIDARLRVFPLTEDC